MQCRGRFVLGAALALAVPALSACGGSMPDVRPVTLAELGKGGAPTLPLVIQLKAGDRIPLQVQVSGDLVESTPAEAGPMLTVKRTFFVVLTEGSPPRISLDGQTLARAPGTLSIGLGVTKDKGPLATVSLGLSSPPE